MSNLKKNIQIHLLHFFADDVCLFFFFQRKLIDCAEILNLQQTSFLVLNYNLTR